MKKDLVWSDLHIARFWDFMATRPNSREKYFTFQNGVGILKLLRAYVNIRGKKVLDYGCGNGFMSKRLMDEGGLVWGLDYSSDSVNVVNANFSGENNWKGCLLGSGSRLPYEDSFFDVIVCIETIEHIAESYLRETFLEFSRVVKRGGIILVTTPHAEDLTNNMVYCPNCEVVFHRMQHMRAFTIEELTAFAAGFGFEPVFAEALNFKSLNRKPVGINSFLDISLRKMYQAIEYELYRLMGKQAELKLLTRKYNSRVHLAVILRKS